MIVMTESGSVYEVENERVCRLYGAHDMRRDGEWIRLLNPVRIDMGQSMEFVLEPLSDDAIFTLRITSPVVNILLERTYEGYTKGVSDPS